MSCLEILTGPVSLYWATVGTAFPDVDAAPGVSWTLIGTSGAVNYSEDGVSVTMNQTIEMFRGLGSTYPSCVFRTEQEVIVGVKLVDLSLSQIRIGMNLNSVASDAGPPAIKTLDLDYGTDVNFMALLLRGTGKSPEFSGSNMQIELNNVYEGASHPLTFLKGTPVGVDLEFHALLDTNGNLGQIVAATA